MQRLIKELVMGKDTLEEAEVNKINEKMKNFESKLLMLNVCDIAIVSSLGVDATFFWATGFLGTLGKAIWVGSSVGLYYLLDKTLRRETLQADFDKALDELYDVYKECTTGHTSAVTFHEDFIKLATTLSYYATDMKDLVAWEVTDANRAQFSQAYLDVFTNRAERLSFEKHGQGQVQPEAGSVLSPAGLYSLYAKGIPGAIKSLEPRTVLGEGWSQFFSTSYEGARMQLRSHDFHKHVEATAQPRKG
jgi:hypothetical protein